jgi:ABC-2 type transport system ATP-binding protein
MGDILQVQNLTKKYGTFCAVNDISFSVKKGKIIGFLGPNGAGKTTTIQMLLGITNPTEGKIRYFDKDFLTHRRECLQRINFTSAFNTLQKKITVWQNLIVFAGLYGDLNPKEKLKELVSYFKIDRLLSLEYGNLSAGERTRVNLVKSLINNPELILMDEPTASLDPDIADIVLTYIEHLREKQNITILYTSHNMDEITRICDEVIFLDHGKIVAQDTPLGLTKRIDKAKLFLTFNKDREIVEKYCLEKKLDFNFPNDNTVVIEVEENKIPEIIFGLSKKEIWITDIEVKKPTLEDVFLHIARK